MKNLLVNFFRSMSEGTVANWNDVQNWEEGNDQQEVWHEWDIMLLIHNLRMGSSIKGMCMWSHSSTNTIYRLLVGYPTPNLPRGNGPEQA